MSRIKRSHVSGPKSAQEVVRAYVNQMIKNQGYDEGLWPSGRKYAFIPVWAAIPHYRWPVDDGREPFTRLADLIQQNPEKRRGDPGLEWLGLTVGSAIDEALVRGFGGAPRKKRSPIVDSEIVNSIESLVDNSAEALMQAELIEKLREATRRLDEPDRKVVEVAYREHLRGRDIAAICEILGCGESAAHARFNKILKTLARMLDEYH